MLHASLLLPLAAACAGLSLAAGPGAGPVSPLVAQESDPDSLTDQLMARAQRAIDESGLEGLAMVVAVGDQVFLQQGFGRMPGRELADPTRPFRAEPLVEPLSAIALLKLMESGPLSPETPVSEQLEGFDGEAFQGTGETLTLDHLLTHTSGLIGWDAVVTGEAREGATLESLLGVVQEQGLESPPGECFAYSEANGLLLGAVLESASKRSLADLITEEVLEPSGAENSGFDLEDAPAKEQVAGGSREISHGLVRAPEGVHVFKEDEFCASAVDLFRVCRALQGGKVLGDEALATLLEPGQLTDGTPTEFGRGLNLTSLDGTCGFSAGGSAEGTTVHVAHYPDPEITVVLLVAEESAPIIALERDLARLVLELPLPGIQDLDFKPEGAEPFVGQYQIGCTTYVVRWSKELERMTVATAERAVVELAYQGGTRFLGVDDPELGYEFIMEEGDKLASRMVVLDHGVRSEAVRFQ